MGRKSLTLQADEEVPRGAGSRPLWSAGLSAGETVFISACAGIEESEPTSLGIEAEVHGALRRIDDLLETAGLSRAEVTCLRALVAAEEAADPLRGALGAYLAVPKPKADAVVSIIIADEILTPDAGVEVEAVASARSPSSRARDLVYARVESGAWASDGEAGLGRWVDLLEHAGRRHGLGLENLGSVTVTTRDRRRVGELQAGWRQSFEARGAAAPPTTWMLAGPSPSRGFEAEAIFARGDRSLFGAADGSDGPATPVASRIGGWVFASGSPRTQLAPATMGAQTEDALADLKRALALAGAAVDDIANITVWLGDVERYSEMYAVRAPFYESEFTSGVYPASTAMVVRSATSRVDVRFDAIAYLGA